MANGSIRILNLASCTSPQAADSLIIESAADGNTQQLSVSNFLGNSSANLISANVVSANVYVIVGNTTPANSSDVTGGIIPNSLWSDGEYIYFYNGVDIKRSQLDIF